MRTLPPWYLNVRPLGPPSNSQGPTPQPGRMVWPPTPPSFYGFGMASSAASAGCPFTANQPCSSRQGSLFVRLLSLKS